MTAIDLNADLGEGEDSDVELLTIVSSCNIACGGHAGDALSMDTTLSAAIENHVTIGAHPSYDDVEGFGRRPHFMRGEPLRESLRQQLRDLQRIADHYETKIAHVKPHGALYNDAADDRELAQDLVSVVAAVLPHAAVVGLPNSAMADAAGTMGLRFIAEGFVDRAYQADGRLLPRSESSAVHETIALMTDQAISLLGRVDTLCIHGDTPGAVAAATAVRDALNDYGASIRAITG